MGRKYQNFGSVGRRLQARPYCQWSTGMFAVYHFCTYTRYVLNLPLAVKIIHQLLVERLKAAIESYLSYLCAKEPCYIYSHKNFGLKTLFEVVIVSICKRRFLINGFSLVKTFSWYIIRKIYCWHGLTVFVLCLFCSNAFSVIQNENV